jgi:hypothetical protein
MRASFSGSDKRASSGSWSMAAYHALRGQRSRAAMRGLSSYSSAFECDHR